MKKFSTEWDNMEKRRLNSLGPEYIKTLKNHYETIKKQIAEIREGGGQVTLGESVDEYCLLTKVDKNDLRMVIRFVDEQLPDLWDEAMASGEFVRKEDIKDFAHRSGEISRKLTMVEYYENLPLEFQTIRIKKKLADLRKEIAKDGLDKWGKEVVEALF